MEGRHKCKQKHVGNKRKCDIRQSITINGVESYQPLAPRTKRERTKKANRSIEFSAEALKKELMRETKVLKIPSGIAEVIVEKMVAEVEKWIKQRPAVTVEDIQRRVAREAKKYNTDLAYVYQNRGKII